MRITQAALVAATILLLGARPAVSSPLEALRMAWDNCPLSGSAVPDKPFTCDTNLGAASLYCAFSLLQPVDQVVGLELVVDVQHSAPIMPDWWRLGPAPDCRHDLLTANIDFSQTDACQDPGFAGALIQDYLITEPRGLPSQARIKAVAYLPSPQTISFGTDTTYDAVHIVLGYDRTVNVNVCAGCTQAACLVFNSVLIRRTKGAPGGDLMITTPGPGTANWATWRSGSGANCLLVPVRRMTWGTVKSLYR